MADWNPQANDIFLEALDVRSPEERLAFLDSACTGNAELRAQVESLLEASDLAGSFLESPAPALGATINQAVSEQPGTMIGPYKLLQQIGEGGMGIVYMAEQTEPVERRVALKIIKPGMDSRKVIARFEAERQALALMDHPNIAKVLDAGTTGPASGYPGRPYFVMELVKGVPITEYCDEKHLRVRQRLELLLPVCQAVQHAHQKGIIHRDIKPSNVMVALYDGRPVPKVIDFGVAKATGSRLTDKTVFTEFGQVVGTLEYMSPEQAELNQLDVDTRSDIYSLGVLLYELLTGTTPLDRKRLCAAAFDEMLRMIREEEPPMPSTRLSTTNERASIAENRGLEPKKLSGLVRGELDWIVMKALEKDRSRRYETANGLAMDISRYLADEAVQACPPSATYRFHKFARRNRVALGTVLLVSAVLVLGTVVSTWQAVRATRAEREADAERRQAEASFQQARATVDEFFTLVSESQLLDVPGLQPLRKDLLERALRYYQDLLTQRGNELRVRAEAAGTYLRMSVIYITVDSGDEAFSHLQKGLAIVEELVQENPKNKELLLPIAGFWNVERLLFNPRTSGPALSDVPAGLKLLRHSAELWEMLVHENPDIPGLQNDLAAFLTYIGDLSWDVGRIEEALSAYQRATDLRVKLVRDNPGSVAFRAALGESHNGLGWMLRAAGRNQDAEQAYRQALAIQEPLVSEYPQIPNHRVVLASCYQNLSEVLREANRLPMAEEMIRRALEITERLTADFPEVPAFEAEKGNNYAELGNDLLAANRFEDSEMAYRRAIGCYQELSDKFPSQPDYGKELGYRFWSLAGLLVAAGRPDEAEQAYRQVVSRFEEVVATYPYLVNYHNHLAQIRSTQIESFKNTGRRKGMENVYREAIEFYDRLVRKFPNDRACQNELARAHEEMRHFRSETEPVVR